MGYASVPAHSGKASASPNGQQKHRGSLRASPLTQQPSPSLYSGQGLKIRAKSGILSLSVLAVRQEAWGDQGGWADRLLRALSAH